MVPKIGVSSKAFGLRSWYREAEKSEFNTIEIYHRTSTAHFLPEFVEKLNKHLKGKDLSMHSFASRIFTEVPQFTFTELNILKSEILLCNMLKAKELIFHMKHEKLNQEEEKEIKKIINFAQKHNVDLVYESNAEANAEVALDNLKRFPELHYNLDFGHLNYGIHSGRFDYDLDEFLKKVKDKTVYIHAHNNDGSKDQHQALTDGNLDWQHVLDSLDMNKVRKIIFELFNPKDIQKSNQALKEYFKK